MEQREPQNPGNTPPIEDDVSLSTTDTESIAGDEFVDVKADNSTKAKAAEEAGRIRDIHHSYRPGEVNAVILQRMLDNKNFNLQAAITSSIVQEKYDETYANGTIRPVFYLFERQPKKMISPLQKDPSDKGKESDEEENNLTENNVAVFITTKDSDDEKWGSGLPLKLALKTYKEAKEKNPHFACRFLAIPISTTQFFPGAKTSRAHFIALIIDTEKNIAYLNDSSPFFPASTYPTTYIEEAIREAFGNNMRFSRVFSGKQGLSNRTDCGAYTSETILQSIKQSKNTLCREAPISLKTRAIHEDAFNRGGQNLVIYNGTSEININNLPADYDKVEFMEVMDDYIQGIIKKDTEETTENKTKALSEEALSSEEKFVALRSALETALQTYDEETQGNITNFQRIKAKAELQTLLLQVKENANNETPQDLYDSLRGGMIYWRNQAQNNHQSHSTVIRFFQRQLNRRSRLVTALDKALYHDQKDLHVLASKRSEKIYIEAYKDHQANQIEKLYSSLSPSDSHKIANALRTA